MCVCESKQPALRGVFLKNCTRCRRRDILKFGRIDGHNVRHMVRHHNVPGRGVAVDVPVLQPLHSAWQPYNMFAIQTIASSTTGCAKYQTCHSCTGSTSDCMWAMSVANPYTGSCSNRVPCMVQCWYSGQSIFCPADAPALSPDTNSCPCGELCVTTSGSIARVYVCWCVCACVYKFVCVCVLCVCHVCGSRRSHVCWFTQESLDCVKFLRIHVL